jgi:hypothetical protein
MLILRGPELAPRIADPGIRQLIEERFAQICNGEAYDYDLHGYMIVVEAGDSVSTIEEESGCPILRDLWDEARFGDPDFAPAAEAIEEHAGCYELTYVLSDSGFGIGIVIPKDAEIDPELLQMCATYAAPAPELTSL